MGLWLPPSHPTGALPMDLAAAQGAPARGQTPLLCTLTGTGKPPCFSSLIPGRRPFRPGGRALAQSTDSYRQQERRSDSEPTVPEGEPCVFTTRDETGRPRVSAAASWALAVATTSTAPQDRSASLSPARLGAEGGLGNPPAPTFTHSSSCTWLGK